MQEVTSEAIILKTVPYKENDRLIYAYTKEYGKITLIAKGVRKLTSKNASACQDLTLVELTMIVRKGLSRLIKATLVDPYRYVKEDLVLQAYASYALEYYYQYMQENEPSLEAYETLEKYLNALKNGYPYALVYCLFNAWILKNAGSSIQVDECTNCAHTSSIASISVGQGGFVCTSCMHENDVVYHRDFLQAFRHLNKASLKDLDKLHIDSSYYSKLITLFEQFMDEYSGMHFRTRKFISQLRDL